MKRVVCALSKKVMSSLTGMPYDEMMSIVRNENTANDLETMQQELVEKVKDSEDVVVKTVRREIEDMLVKYGYEDYNPEDIAISLDLYDGSVAEGIQYATTYVPGKSYKNVIDCTILYKRVTDPFNARLSAIFIDGNMRYLQSKWEGERTARLKSVNAEELEAVRGVFEHLKNNKSILKGILTSIDGVQQATQLQKKIASTSKKFSSNSRAVFWNWCYLNKKVLAGARYDRYELFIVSGVCTSGVPSEKSFCLNLENNNIEFSDFPASNSAKYLLNCTVDDVLSGKVIDISDMTYSGRPSNPYLTIREVTCPYKEIEFPPNVRINFY